MRHAIIKALLNVAKSQKLDASRLAGTAKLDYSSSRRLLTGKSLQPSFAMIAGLAYVTGFKLKLVRAKRPTLSILKRPAVKPGRKPGRPRKAGRRKAA